MCIRYFLLLLGQKDHFHIDLSDEVVRGSIVLHDGKLMWPPPTPKDPSPAVAAAKPATPAKVVPPEPNYFNVTLKDSLVYTAGKSDFIMLWMIACRVLF